MTGTSVVAYEAASLTDRMKYAQTIAAADQMIPRGLFDNKTGRPSPPKVLLVMETGAMLGLHPMAALQSIDVVEGRATLSAKLMAALIRKAGHRLSIVKTGSVPGGNYSVTVTGTRMDAPLDTYTSKYETFTSTWDIPRALRAGLVDSYKQNSQGVWEVRARSEKNNPKPWETYTESMPVWRAISEVGREGFADVLFGLYSTEEMTDGGIPIADPDPEPTEPWEDLIAACQTRDELDQVAARLKEKGEGTDKLRAIFLARAGFLAREANTVDAEEANDETTEEAVVVDEQETYEAEQAALFDAAVEAGETHA